MRDDFGMPQIASVKDHGQLAMIGSGQQYNSFGVSSVPVAAALRDPGLVYTAVDVNAFTGRDWLAEDIDRFIAANPAGYVFIEAEAGLGKTAFAAWLVKERGYLSHFSRYSGGRTVRSALQNMSAQLISRFQLGEFAPGGMLSEWAQSPEGFEFLLGKAAECARAEERPLVLVVDGLDEAEGGGGGALPFGLPKLLPAGAYVIATFRAGRSPGQPDTPVVPLRIGKDDPRNASDIEAFLIAAVAEEVLAARLTRSGVDPVGFVRRLAERCGGVWVYLRYVLQELRLGLRDAGAAGDLPAGLRAYYADQIRRWEDDPGWADQLLPLLATLAVAGEPLPVATLARLAGELSVPVVRRLCDLTFRPLLTTTRPERGAPLRYEIYHASLRQVLKAERGAESDADGWSYELEALADELRESAVAAHRRIASRYLNAFGGLERGLPVLAADPAAAAADDGYPLGNLARHLHHADQVSELHRLLAVTSAVDTADGGRPGNVWFAAHDTADCLVSYLDDVARARAVSAAATDRALGRRQKAPAVGAEVRYALMAASISSRAASIWPELLDQLVRAGLWSAGRGLDHARRLATADARVRALMVMYRHVPADQQGPVAAEALDAALSVRDAAERARVLTDLAGTLPPGDRGAVLDRVLDAAEAIPDEDTRTNSLTPLMADLPAGQLARVLAMTGGFESAHDRAVMLIALAPRLADDQRAATVNQALDIIRDSNLRTRGVLLAYLAGLVPADEQPAVVTESLDAVAAAVGGGFGAHALALLAPHLSAVQLTQALAIAKGFDNDDSRAVALTGLAPYLAAGERDTALSAALTAVAEHFYADSAALANLAPLLSPAQLSTALELAAERSSGESLVAALTVVAPHLSTAGQLSRAVEIAAGTEEPYHHVRALTILVRHLPPEQRPAVLTAAIDIAATVAAPRSHGYLLTLVASSAPADQQPALLAQAFEALATVGDGPALAGAIAALVPHLPDAQRPAATEVAAAIADGGDRARALLAVARHLPPAGRPSVVAAALDATAAITADYARASALTELAPFLGADGELTQALAIADGIGNDRSRITALLGLVQRLPAERRLAIVKRAFDIAARLADDYSLGAALAELAPVLPADLLDLGLRAAQCIGTVSMRGAALAALIPRLPAGRASGVLAGALESVLASEDDLGRTSALSQLAPFLSAGQLNQALDAAAIDVGSDRQPLVELARRAAAIGEPDLLARLLAVAESMGEPHYADVVGELAPRLSAAQLADAVKTAADSADAYFRARALIGLAPYLPAGQRTLALDDAARAADAVENDIERIGLLTELAGLLPAEEQPAAWTRALDAIAAGNDFVRSNTLGDLVARLPAGHLSRALDIAATDGKAVLAVLEQSRSVLPADSTESLSLFRSALTGKDRATCLSMLAMMAPNIAAWGGSEAAAECLRAIADVTAWWP